jgi:hypothetical protein
MIPLMVEEDCKLSPAALCCLCLHGAESQRDGMYAHVACRQGSTRQGLAWTVRAITRRSLSLSLSIARSAV